MSTSERAKDAFVEMYKICEQSRAKSGEGRIDCGAIKSIRSKENLLLSLEINTSNNKITRKGKRLYGILKRLFEKMKSSPLLKDKALTLELENLITKVGSSKANISDEDLQKLYFLLQFLIDPSGVGMYEVLYTDKVLDENHRYSKKMNLAQSYVNEVAKAMKCAYGSAFVFKARAVSPIVAGRSFLDLLLEYGLAWDPVLDLPYIPASELKGAVRSFALKVGVLDFLESGDKDKSSIDSVLQMTGRGAGRPFTWDEVREILEANGITEKSNNSVENLLNASSDEGEVGGLKISDAYPVGPIDRTPLELLVLTPHYTSNVEQEYDVSPIPIKYLGIRRGTELLFAVGVSKKAKEALKTFAEAKGLKISEEELLKTIISEALELGVGRRTSRGMGKMRLISMEEVKECGQSPG